MLSIAPRPPPRLAPVDVKQTEDEGLINRWKASLKNPVILRQLVKLLGGTRAFAETNEDFRACIAQEVVPQQCPAGEHVQRVGDAGNWMGIVLTGQLGRQMQDGAFPIFAGDIRHGGTVGDLGLFHVSQTRLCTVVAVVDTVLLLLSRASYEKALLVVGGGPVLDQLSSRAARWRELVEDPECFCSLKCFQGLEKGFGTAIHRLSEPRLFYPNEILVKEMDLVKDTFILSHGQVRAEEASVLVAEHCSGTVLGGDGPRIVTVTCTSLCIVHVLRSSVFNKVMQNFPNAKRHFDLQHISQRACIELEQVKGEMENLSCFYGSPHPLKAAVVEGMIEKYSLFRGHGRRPTKRSTSSRCSNTLKDAQSEAATKGWHWPDPELPSHALALRPPRRVPNRRPPPAPGSPSDACGADGRAQPLPAPASPKATASFCLRTTAEARSPMVLPSRARTHGKTEMQEVSLITQPEYAPKETSGRDLATPSTEAPSGRNTAMDLHDDECLARVRGSTKNDGDFHEPSREHGPARPKTAPSRSVGGRSLRIGVTGN